MNLLRPSTKPSGCKCIGWYICDSCRVVKMFEDAIDGDGKSKTIYVDAHYLFASDDNNGLTPGNPMKTANAAHMKMTNSRGSIIKMVIK